MSPPPDATCGRLPPRVALPAARQSRFRGVYLMTFTGSFVMFEQ